VKTIACEYVIVGTGAAGPVLAYNLARAGKDVLLLERGPDVPPEKMSQRETDMIARLFKDGGAQMNTACDMFLLQGNCVGGSTTLTNGVCFHFPDDVLDRWEQHHDVVLDRARLAAAQRRVDSVLNVHELERDVFNPGTPLLEAGARKLGLEPRGFRKNFLDCIGCGYCTVGCRYGRKMHSGATWVPMAREKGCRLLTDTEAIAIETGTASVHGLRCRNVETGETFRVTAKRYVLSCGAINSSGLLLKSGIAGEGTVGRWVAFNVGSICFAEFPEPIDAFDGDQMCVWIDGRPDYVIEQLHNPPASFALTLPLWHREHYDQLDRYRYMTGMGALVATEPSGQVFHPKLPRWHEEIRFKASAAEMDRMRRGIDTIARVFLASGAKRVIPPCAETLVIEGEKDLAGLPQRFREQKQLSGFGSSHPHGGCRMGTKADNSVVDPEFRVWGFDNLYVCDASVFPTSLGVNPQVPIMAIADYAVHAIAGVEPLGVVEDGPVAEARRRLGLGPEDPVLLPSTAGEPG
jgi:choline dehydrogenase-like flavoprotein